MFDWSNSFAKGSARWLGLLCAGRVATGLIAMTYAACLPELMVAWGMGAARAGSIQSAYNLGLGASLLVVSWLSDHVDPRRVLLVSSLVGSGLSLCFAFGARSFETALLLYGLVGVAQGGAYTPAIMVAAARVVPEKRGRAIGELLASASLGYVGSLLFSGLGLALGGYRLAFLLCALGPLVGVVFFWAAVRGTHAVPVKRTRPRPSAMGRRGRLLVFAYAGHCWELLGLWAWVPAFLAVAALSDGYRDAAAFGAWITAVLHLTGVVAAVVAGRLSDRTGRRHAILVFAAAGTALSFVVGWLIGAPIWLLVAICALYGFAALGDSPVLSTALTEALPDGGLGRAFGLRSALGFLVGALAVVVFGGVIEATVHLGGAVSWGLGFSLLGLGGLATTLLALGLERDRP